MAKVNRARVGGSSFTAFYWKNKPIGFCRQVQHVSPPPVGPGAVPIQPLDERHPVEIITPVAASMGQLTLELYELYSKKAWDELAGLTGAHDIVAIFSRVANTAQSITLNKHVRPPKGHGANYIESYNNCVITNVLDGETIEVGTMEVLKQIQVGYTKMRRNDASGTDQGQEPGK